MKLSDAEYKRLLAHVQSKWRPPTECAVCKSNNWNVSREVYEIREFQHGGMVLGGNTAIAPLCPVTCNTCGNTVLFNALVAGINLSGPATQ